MARGVNKVILVGHLGRDPEIRYTPSGSAIATLRLATTDAWRDKQTGEQREKTEWHRLVAFNRTAEIAGEYLRKGRQVYIEGRLQTRKWQDDNNQDRYTTEIVVNDLQMLGGRGEGGGSAGFSEGAPPASGRGYGNKPAQDDRGPEGEPQQGEGGGFSYDFDDDIPF